jgi:hypothetical protein
MLRIVMALLVSGTLAVGALGPGRAQEQTAAMPVRQTVPNAHKPLAPGGAAGIKQAQAQRGGIRNFIPLGIVTGLALLVVFATGDDDNSATATTGSN